MSEHEEVYPLHNDVYERLTTSQKIQIALMTFTVVPIRIILMVIVLAILWPLSILITYGQWEKMQQEPLSGWRKSMYPLVRFVSRGLFFFAGMHCIKVYGERDPKVRILTAAPHSSFMDSIFIVYMNFLSIIARAGSDQVTLFGNLTKMCHPILVNREKQQSRSDTVNMLIERVKSGDNWPQICIFPEGTCTNRKALVQFKTGAFIPGLPVQPVCVKYPSDRFDSISWTWKGPGAFATVWLTLCKFHSPVEIHFMPVYYPSDEETKNPTLYADNVRKLMAGHLRVPLSDYSYEDGILIKILAKHGLPMHTGLVKIQKLRKKLGLSEMDDILKIIPLYAQLADKKTGLVQYDLFIENLGFEADENASILFNMFDQERNGNFGLKNFIKVYFEKIQPVVNKSDLMDLILKNFDRDEYNSNEFNALVKQRFGLQLPQTQASKEPQAQTGFKWPKLNNAEMVKYYKKIEQDNMLILSWANPGRIDPMEYEKLHPRVQDQNQKPEDSQTEMPVMTNTGADTELQKFNLFDEFTTDEFNSNQVIKLTHVKTSRDCDKKMASMDKILDDMRKKFEYEQKNGLVSAECMDFVNDGFVDEQLMQTNENENNQPAST